MAKIHLVCPFCNKHLETSSSNEGREGQCPACENVFDIRGLGPDPKITARAPAEYSDRGLVTFAAVAAGLLLALAATALMTWSSQASQQAFFAGERTAVMGASIICAVFLLVSLLGRKPLAPAVLVASGWAMTASIWLIGLWLSVSGTGASEANPAKLGLYAGSGLACLALAASGYLVFQFRGGDVLKGIGLFFAGVQALAIVAGVLTLTMHVRPALHPADGRRASSPPTRNENGEKNQPAARRTVNGNQTPTRRTEVQPGPDPSDVTPEPTPPPAEKPEAVIWIEGENAAQNDFISPPERDAVLKDRLSGESWIWHYSEERAGVAQYAFDVKVGDDYSLWLHVNPDKSELQYSIDEGRWQRVSFLAQRDVQNLNIQGVLDGRFIAWVPVGELKLEEGHHELRIRTRGPTANTGGIDCICFLNFDWKPTGTAKPQASAPDTPGPREPVQQVVNVEGEVIWLEGEDASRNMYNSVAAFDVPDKAELSGRNWAWHLGRRPGTASWDFEAREGGIYRFWVRCLVGNIKPEYTLNSSRKQPIDFLNAARDTVSLGVEDKRYKRQLDWVDLGPVQLREGANTLAITQSASADRGGGVDCICFLKSNDWKPKGTQKPQQRR